MTNRFSPRAFFVATLLGSLCLLALPAWAAAPSASWAMAAVASEKSRNSRANATHVMQQTCLQSPLSIIQRVNLRLMDHRSATEFGRFYEQRRLLHTSVDSLENQAAATQILPVRLHPKRIHPSSTRKHGHRNTRRHQTTGMDVSATPQATTRIALPDADLSAGRIEPIFISPDHPE